jgi:predicted RNase H-like HicB family nuclease
MREITFVVTGDEVDGGYTARSHWPDGNRDLFTEGDSRDELVRNIREIIDLTADGEVTKPELIHLHFVHNETTSVMRSQ